MEVQEEDEECPIDIHQAENHKTEENSHTQEIGFLMANSLAKG